MMSEYSANRVPQYFYFWWDSYYVPVKNTYV
jgi:hypothetical protein